MLCSMNEHQAKSPKFQVHIIRDVIGTDYAVIDTGKPSFSNGYSNSLGVWPSLEQAQSVAENENKRHES